MTIKNKPSADLRPLPYITGKWAPRKATQQFPQKQKMKTLDQLTSVSAQLYDEYRVPVSSGRELGVYLRPDYLQNPNPPIIVVVGALGFGGSVPANSWRVYLENWNPILIDSRGAGNSFPLGDKEALSIDGTTDDFLEIIAKFGIAEAGIIGRSFGGTVALALADKMNAMGLSVPFVAGVSPTLCTSDREWSFSYEGISQKFSSNVTSMGLQRWNDLIEPLNGLKPDASNVLATYSKLLRSADTKTALQSSMRMNSWEDVPYLVFEPEKFVETVEKGLKPGKTLDNFIGELGEGRADIEEYFYNEKNIAKDDPQIDVLRTQYRLARHVARKMVFAILWTESWDQNCGYDDNGIRPLLERMKLSGTKGFLSLNAGDPLLPEGQVAEWQESWDEAINVYDLNEHGLCDVSVMTGLYNFLESRRLELCGMNPEALELRKARCNDARTLMLDMGSLLKNQALNDPRLTTIALLTMKAGNMDEIVKLANELPEATEQEIEQRLQECNIPQSRLQFEEQRFEYFVTEKKQWLQKPVEQKCAFQ